MSALHCLPAIYALLSKPISSSIARMPRGLSGAGKADGNVVRTEIFGRVSVSSSLQVEERVIPAGKQVFRYRRANACQRIVYATGSRIKEVKAFIGARYDQLPQYCSVQCGAE